MQRREDIIQILAPLGGKEVFDVNSPKYSPDRQAALDWLVLDDSVQSSDLSLVWKIRQRYILALFYFSTHGSNWKDKYYFLSELDECDWSSVKSNEGSLFQSNDQFKIKGIVCNTEDRIERIRICELFVNVSKLKLVSFD